TRLKQSQKNSPIATTIIDRDMIEASGFTEIPDLLRLAPGMLVNYDSGHIASVGYPFLFNRYTVRFQVLVNGQSVYTPLFGEMPWTQLGITIDDIERIEVMRGPSSASYGPNAMTGVISIVTRDAALDAGAKIKANQGVNGRSEQFVTLGDSINAFDYKLSLAARKDDGFKQRYDSKKLWIANFRGDYQATNHDEVTFFLDYNSGEYQEDSTETLNDSMPDHTKDVVRESQQIKWTHSLSSSDAFTLNYYQQYFDDKNSYIGDFTDDGLGFVYVNESVTTRRENLEVAYSAYSEAYSFTLGALYRKDNTIASEFLYNTNKDIHTKQIFINAELHLNTSNVLNLSFLRDDNETGGVTSSPRVSLNHQINKNNMLRVSYAESTRSPFSLEEYANRVVYVPVLSSNVDVWLDFSDLEPEKIRSYDIGYMATLNNNSTELDVRIYRSQLSNLIIQDWGIGGGFRQGDGFHVIGRELTLSHKFKNTRAVINYAQTNIYADDLVFAEAHWFETGTPADNASILVMHDFGKGVNGALGYYYTGTYQQLCCETQQQTPRKRIDLTFSSGFKLGENNSRLKLVLQNISNEKVDTLLLNNYERQGYISFSMEL
ncbi:MAG: TonB-dependent receptor plug domain-containing protein, partial [Desulfobacter sp.]|nr:TonB-dependent receptor plug domain-containing protein [Desulfobacter sp.]